MTDNITGSFATRRAAEMAIERLVQEHNIARDAIEIAPVDEENTVGSMPGGVDRQKTTGDDSSPALHGRINVTVRVDDLKSVNDITQALREFGADAASS